jgi:dTDP-glucose 4,6-dehydratase
MTSPCRPIANRGEPGVCVTAGNGGDGPIERGINHEEIFMQNLLVTGGAGFIGCNYVRLVLDTYPDYRVVVYDKLTYAGRLENLADVARKHEDRFTFVQGDICDADAVEAVIQAHDIDTIVNFAAETHVDRSILEPDAFIQTDVYGTYVLLEAARKFGQLRYHQISTDEVYGHIHGDHRSLESDCLAPRSPYAASKASADHLVNAYFITYDLPITISRGANNIGPFQYPEKVVPLFVTNALNDMPLPVYGDGKQQRDYQYVNDHCEAIDLVLQKGTIGEVYNIGTGVEMTNLEMVEILLDEVGKPRSLIQHVEDRMGHDRRYCMDVRKVMALGWEPDYTCEEAIRATVRWYMANETWWQPIREGEFKEYYQRLYGDRKVLS